MQFFLKFVLIQILAWPIQSFSASGDLPPELAARLAVMSAEQKLALSREYGIDPSQFLGFEEADRTFAEPAIGEPGTRLIPRSDVEESEVEELRMLLEAEMRAERELERFGTDIFNEEVSTFAPVDNIPVPEGYRLGVGDQINVTLLGKEEREIDLLIGRDGAVIFPKLGRVFVAGLTFEEVAKKVISRVSNQLIGTEAIVSMGRLRSINVFLSGEVNRPGNYSASALTTLTQALYIAGGISEIGSYRDVQLKRSGVLIGSFDVYDLLLEGDNSKDVRLQSGDVIFVPVSGSLVSVGGKVIRPAIYELKVGETLTRAIEMAGGFSARSNTKQVLLNRFSSTDSLPELISLDFQDSDIDEIAAQDGDQITVREIPERVSNPVSIEGFTALEGVIGWFKNIKISDVFRDLESDLDPLADREIALIIRRTNERNDIEVIPFSFSEALGDPGSQSNIILNVFDRIIVLPLPNANDDDLVGVPLVTDERFRGEVDGESIERTRNELILPIVDKLRQQAGSGRTAEVVTIDGAVRLPGEYPLIGGSIAQLVQLAGGFSDGAYLKAAEIRRIEYSGNDEQAEIRVFSVDLSNNSQRNSNLKPRDTLRVNFIPNYSVDETVELTGEFRFPGRYTVSQGEKLSSLISRAGGFSAQAFLEGARYFSATARESQAAQLEKIAASVERRIDARSVTGAGGRLESGREEGADEEAAIDSEKNKELLGRIVVDLNSIIAGSEQDDIIVGKGDSIHIPKFSPTIAVVGEVYEPGTFSFESYRSISDYIELAGGSTSFALNKSTYVLKANGSVTFGKNAGLMKRFTSFNPETTNAIEPGDIIVVPVDLDYDPPLERIQSVTNVLFQSLSSIAAFLSIAR